MKSNEQTHHKRALIWAKTRFLRWPNRYKFYPDLGKSIDGLVIRPIHIDDHEEIRKWRNSQVKILRQKHPLTKSEQKAYFFNTLRKSMLVKHPDQILFCIEDRNELVAYGGLVHISWPDRRAELSFLTAGSLSDGLSERYFKEMLNYIFDVGRNQFGLHKLVTETYSFRDKHIQILESSGFKKEGELGDHVQISNEFFNLIIHGVLLD